MVGYVILMCGQVLDVLPVMFQSRDDEGVKGSSGNTTSVQEVGPASYTQKKPFFKKYYYTFFQVSLLSIQFSKETVLLILFKDDYQTFNLKNRLSYSKKFAFSTCLQ